MYKLISLVSISIVLLFFACTNREKSKNSLQGKNIRGKVKTLTEYTYEIYDTTRILTEKRYSEYDENGNEVLLETYGIDLKPITKQTREYDSYNNELKCIADGELSERKYDEHNNMVELQNTHGSVYTGKYTYKYDDKNNVMEKYDYNCSSPYNNKEYAQKNKLPYNDIIGGVPVGKYTRTYNDSGWTTKEVTYNTIAEKISSIRFYQYDHKGNLTELKTTDQYGSVTRLILCKYDDKNNCIEYIENNFNRDYPKIKGIYQYESYDKNGNWTQGYFTQTYWNAPRILKREIVYW